MLHDGMVQSPDYPPENLAKDRRQLKKSLADIDAQVAGTFVYPPPLPPEELERLVKETWEILRVARLRQAPDPCPARLDDDGNIGGCRYSPPCVRPCDAGGPIKDFRQWNAEQPLSQS